MHRCVKIPTTDPSGYDACRMNDLGIIGSHFQCYSAILGMGTPCTCLCTFAEADVRTFTWCSLGGDKQLNLYQQWQACKYTTTATPITCDGSQIPYWTDHTYWRQDSSPGRVGVGSSLVFRCNEGYRQGTVVYTCGADGKFWTTDR